MTKITADQLFMMLPASGDPIPAHKLLERARKLEPDIAMLEVSQLLSELYLEKRADIQFGFGWRRL